VNGKEEAVFKSPFAETGRPDIHDYAQYSGILKCTIGVSPDGHGAFADLCSELKFAERA
jgi:hypothetical protein